MSKLSLVRSCGGLLAVMGCSLSTALAQGDPAPSTPAAEIVSQGLSGAYFVENLGQWSDAAVHFGLKSRGLNIAVRRSSMTIHMLRETSAAGCGSTADGSASDRGGLAGSEASDLGTGTDLPRLAAACGAQEEIEPTVDQLTLSVTFPGSNDVLPVGAAARRAKFNYFVGDDETTWAAEVPSYGAVVFKDLYDGIDLHIMGGDGGSLKYEFHCSPGADYEQIRIRYDGIDSLSVDDGGDLEIETRFGSLRDSAPVVWQIDPSNTLGARFHAIDAQTYGFVLLEAPEPALPLTIDPEIEWMYFFGGTASDMALQVILDQGGNALVTGHTFSDDFSGRNNAFNGGEWDAFAFKTDPTGELMWMTYLGGSGDDRGRGVALGSNDDVMIAGYTTSTDFAGRSNSYLGGISDTYAAMLSPTGQLQWMKYYGGSGEDRGRVVITDESGFALITGETASADYVGHRNAYHGGDIDGFVQKINFVGDVEWVNFFGGTDADLGYAMVIDAAEDIILIGYTWSADFEGRTNEHHGGGRDAYALKFKPSGEVIWMTYFGGNADDEAWAVVLDRWGNALICGRTVSTNFTGALNAYPGGPSCAYALRVDAGGELDWMRYFGGTGEDGSRNLALDSRGNLLLTGHTSSTDFEGATNLYHGGAEDGFLLQCSSSGELAWMSYQGGSGWDFGSGIILHDATHVLVAGRTTSVNFSGQTNSHHGALDATLLRIELPDPGLQLDVFSSCPFGGTIEVAWFGATGGGQIALLYARNTGAFIIPSGRPCAGTTLGLGSSQIRIAYQGSAGQDGSRIVSSNTGPSACGGYLQLLDITTCGTSNVMRIE